MQNPVRSLRYSDKDIKMSPSEKIFGVHVDYNSLWNNHFNMFRKNLIIFMVTEQNKIIFVSREPSYNAILNRILINALLFGATIQVLTSIKYLNYKDVLVN